MSERTLAAMMQTRGLGARTATRAGGIAVAPMRWKRVFRRLFAMTFYHYTAVDYMVPLRGIQTLPDSVVVSYVVHAASTGCR